MFELKEALRELEKIKKESDERGRQLDEKREALRREACVYQAQRDAAQVAAQHIRRILGLAPNEEIPL